MFNNFHLIFFYTSCRLKSETARNFIGYFWWVLDPILSVSVYFIFFKVLLQRGNSDYIQFISIGIICWKWFSTAIQSGSMSIYKERALTKKIYIPKIIFPWIDLNFHTVKFLAVFLLALFIFPAIGYSVTILHLYIPILLISLYVLILGISTCLASVTPFFPDAKNIIAHLLRLLFYPSGILFSLDMIPEKYHRYVEYNPIAQAIGSIRNIIMYEKAPSIQGILLPLCIGILTYLIGSLLIKKFEGQYAKIL